MAVSMVLTQIKSIEACVILTTVATLEEVSKSGHGYEGMGNIVCARGTVKYCNHLKNHQAVPSEAKRTFSFS